MIMNERIASRMTRREIVIAALLALLTLPAWSPGQSPRDGEGRQVVEPNADAPSLRDRGAKPQSPPMVLPVAIGTIDMERVMKGFTMVKDASKRLKAGVEARKEELKKLREEANREEELMSKLVPGSQDYKEHEAHRTKLLGHSRPSVSLPSRSTAVARPAKWPPSTRTFSRRPPPWPGSGD